MKKSLLLVAGLSLSVQAGTISLTANPAAVIPDGSSSGFTSQLSVSGNPESIISVSVDVNFSPVGTGVLGDLYLYLSNGTESVILMNRWGKTGTNPIGYTDSQSVDVTFADVGLSDFHLYRESTEDNDDTTALTSTLTGIWMPDARAVDPAAVVDTDPRTADFSLLSGSVADGTYTLFAADLSGGNQYQLDSWTLNIETVPEPSSFLLTLLALPALLIRKRS